MPVRLALLALLALPACDFLDQLRDPQSEPQPIELVSADEFYGDGSVIAGGGQSPFVAYSRWDANTGTRSVRVLRHDAARPDSLELVGDFGTGSDPRLFVQEDVAVVCDGADMRLIEVASPALSSTAMASPTFGPPQALAVSGRWLVAASDSTLALLDLQTPTSVTSYAAPAAVTAVLATQGTFLAFTATGYVHVTPDPASPTFTAVSDPVLRNFRSAFPDGAEAMVAGPSLALGRSRVVRLDLADPAAPAVRRSHEVDGAFRFFAWDGASISVIATGGDGANVHEGYVVHEAREAFTSQGIPLPAWWRDGNPIAAHAGRLFALSSGGLGFYRINR